MSDEYRVKLYVYDLSQGMAKQFSPMFLGTTIDAIYHTGVVVYNQEFFFGGGICHTTPGNSAAGQPQEIVDMGTTMIPQDVFMDFLREVSPRFTTATYSLFRHNCNNFSNEVVQFLTGSHIPQRITGLPEEVLSTPLGQMFRPVIEQFETQMRQQAVGTEMHFIPGNGQPIDLNTVPPELQPTHPHAQLECKVISKDAQPKASRDSKAPQYIASIRAIPQLAERVSESEISSTQRFLASPDTDGVPSDVFRFFDKLVTTDHMSVLALLRLALLHEEIAEYYGPHGMGWPSFSALLTRTTSADCVDRPDKTTCVLMAVCCLSNAMTCPRAAPLFSTEPVVLETVASCLRHSHDGLRLMSAVAAFNSCVSLQDTHDHSDANTHLAAALAEAVANETHAPVRRRQLLALGHLMHCNDEICGLLQALEFGVPHEADDDVKHDIELMLGVEPQE